MNKRAIMIASAAALSLAAATDAMAAATGPTPRTESQRPTPAANDPKAQAREADYNQAEYLIKADKCEDAIPLLLRVVKDNEKDADALNLLGFCHRKLGKYPESLAFYKRALAVNSDHLGANEYLGELYLKMNDLPKAEAQLAILKKLCPKGCEELEDLEADIAEYKEDHK